MRMRDVSSLHEEVVVGDLSHTNPYRLVDMRIRGDTIKMRPSKGRTANIRRITDQSKHLLTRMKGHNVAELGVEKCVCVGAEAPIRDLSSVASTTTMKICSKRSNPPKMCH
jgi:hypothetical protein